jgi:hypothetical protein
MKDKNGKRKGGGSCARFMRGDSLILHIGEIIIIVAALNFLLRKG